jgi:hypothetical protein
MATSAQFVATAIIGQVKLDTADATWRAGGTLGAGSLLLYTADASVATRIDRIEFQALAINTLTVIGISLSTDGTNYYAIRDVARAAVSTASTTVAADFYSFDFPNGLILPASTNYKIKVSTAVINTWAVTAYGGKY